MATLEQERAEYAWEQVQGCGEKYTSLAKGAPALIMGNGLMQSLAFYASKGQDQDHHNRLNNHILGWLKKRELVSSDEFQGAMEDLSRHEPAKYRRATQETLEFLKWARQFAPTVERREG